MMSAFRYTLSRTAASGYLEPNPDWSVTSQMVTNQEIVGYESGQVTDWYDLLTNDNIFARNYNVSITNSTDKTNLMSSIGYTEELGYMLNDEFSRVNGRLNFDTKISDGFKISGQTYFTSSHYSIISSHAFLNNWCWDCFYGFRNYDGVPITICDISDARNQRSLS
jgi:hypothetical protein